MRGNWVLDLLVKVLCDWREFVGNGRRKVGVIWKGMRNLVKSMK